jgi:hypothetical protein
MAKKARKAKRRPNQRPTSVTIYGIKCRRGEKILPGRYRLVNIYTKRVFVASLVGTINKGKNRLAIFSVPKS